MHKRRSMAGKEWLFAHMKRVEKKSETDSICFNCGVRFEINHPNADSIEGDVKELRFCSPECKREHMRCSLDQEVMPEIGEMIDYGFALLAE